MQDASTLATAHYPETLDRIFVSIVPSLGVARIQQTLIFPDYRSAFFLPDRLGLGKKMV